MPLVDMQHIYCYSLSHFETITKHVRTWKYMAHFMKRLNRMNFSKHYFVLFSFYTMLIISPCRIMYVLEGLFFLEGSAGRKKLASGPKWPVGRRLESPVLDDETGPSTSSSSTLPNIQLNLQSQLDPIELSQDEFDWALSTWARACARRPDSSDCSVPWN